MKTILYPTILATLFTLSGFAQDVTTVNAIGSDISDNLDLKAVASIFGESSNLEDFERRLNDPKMQISNLDLNNDNQVDYLRVIESIEGNAHLIILQSVLDRDVYQDIATITVERDNNNQVQVQVIGDVYMYGQNYIYQPVYVNRPALYNNWWIGTYNPYVSIYHWNYYPTYYTYWQPYPVYKYRQHVHVYINTYNNYNYVNYRTNQRAYSLYSGIRSNGYERRYPTRSFEQRNTRVSNRYELEKTRRENNNGMKPRSNSGSRQAIQGERTATRAKNYKSNSAGSNVKTNNQVSGSVLTTANTRYNPIVNNNAKTERYNNQRTVTPKSYGGQKVSTTGQRQNVPVRAQAQPKSDYNGSRQSSPAQSSTRSQYSGARESTTAQQQSRPQIIQRQATPSQSAVRQNVAKPAKVMNAGSQNARSATSARPATGGASENSGRR